MRITSPFLYVAIGLALAVVIGAFASSAQANPSAFATTQSAAATSTYNRVALGVGTTTITYIASQGNLAADSATLQLQMNASTTNPIVAIRVEHSRDCIDWYPEAITTTIASTTRPGLFIENQIGFGTSTAAATGLIGSGNATTTYASFPVATPTRCTRAVVYGVSGSGSLYGEIVAKQQVR